MKRLVLTHLLMIFMAGPVFAQGQVMPVLFLNGTGAYAQLPGPLTDNLVNATVEGWVKWESLNKWSRVFDFGKEGNAAVLQNDRQTATLFFSLWDRSSKLHRAEGFKAIEQSKWQHMAIVCGKTGMQLYVNGELVGQDKYVIPFNAISGGNNYLGKSNWDSDEPFHGYIADFRVWSTPRSQAEIRQTMFTQLKGDEPGLAGYWRFESAADAQSPDLTPAALHANLMDGATVMNAPGPPISLISLEPDVPPGIPPADLHKLMIEVALQDHRLDETEKSLIQAVRQAGSLSATEAKELEMAIRKDLKVGPQTSEEETYFKALQSAHSDGILTPSDVTLLQKMQGALSIEAERVKQLKQTLPKQAKLQEPAPEPEPKQSPDAYRVLVQTALMDRHIDKNEQTMLKQIASANNLTEASAAEVVTEIKKDLGIGPQTEPEKTYFTVLTTALTDGTLSTAEQAMLQTMQASLNLSGERAEALKKDVMQTLPEQPPETPTSTPEQ